MTDNKADAACLVDANDVAVKSSTRATPEDHRRRSFGKKNNPSSSKIKKNERRAYSNENHILLDR